MEFDTFVAFVNHSCDPNAFSYFRNEMVEDITKEVTSAMFAVRDIGPGEQILESYDLYCEGKYFHGKRGSMRRG